MISENIIIVKRDWFLIRNICIVMYQYIGKISKLDTFKWLKLIADLFHLQIIILKTFFQILYGKLRDTSSLTQCHDALKYPKVFKDMKNFHIYKDFFKIIINVNVITLYIIYARCNNINIYKR